MKYLHVRNISRICTENRAEGSQLGDAEISQLKSIRSSAAKGAALEEVAVEHRLHSAGRCPAGRHPATGLDQALGGGARETPVESNSISFDWIAMSRCQVQRSGKLFL